MSQFHGQFQIQAQPTITIFQDQSGGEVLPTPVLSVDFNQHLSWVSELGKDQLVWKILNSQSAGGPFVVYDQIPAGDTGFDFDVTLTGYYWKIIGYSDPVGDPVTNPSNVVQAPAAVFSVGDVDSPEIYWGDYGGALPTFWSVFQYNGSGDINDPANYSFLDSTDGANLAYPVDSGSLALGQYYIVRGTVTPNGTAQTVYSNPCLTLP